MPKILSSRVTWDADGIDYVSTHTLSQDVTDDEVHDYFPAGRGICRAEIKRFPDRIEVTQRHICNI